MSEHVLEVVIRCNSSPAAEWVLSDVRKLLASYNNVWARLDAAGIIEAAAYDAPQPGDDALLARLVEA